MQAYPRAWLPHGLLSGGIYNTLGKYEKSVDEAKIAIAIDPDFSIGYSILAGSYLALGRTGEAENTLQRASGRKLDIPDFHVQRYVIAFLKDDKTGMKREAAQSREKPGMDDWMSNAEGFVAAYSGRLEEARKMSQRAADLARKEARQDATGALRNGCGGARSTLRKCVRRKTKSWARAGTLKSRDVENGAAFALALSRDSSRSRTVIDDLSKRFPEDTVVQFTYLPALRAFLAFEPRPAGRRRRTPSNRNSL